MKIEGILEKHFADGIDVTFSNPLLEELLGGKEFLYIVNLFKKFEIPVQVGYSEDRRILFYLYPQLGYQHWRIELCTECLPKYDGKRLYNALRKHIEEILV